MHVGKMSEGVLLLLKVLLGFFFFSVCVLIRSCSQFKLLFGCTGVGSCRNVFALKLRETFDYLIALHAYSAFLGVKK